ncbi:MAG: DUF4829 domain-containing protein [Romboutsia sp.]|uniref:DUF4829 domain-containing protein n=1 Tax=Romboutsia sp. TaxID=1965302 RepID=UPI003F2CB149
MKNNPRNNQLIAFLIFIPMLIFTFFVTIKSEGIGPIDDGKQTITKYFYSKNEKDLLSLSRLLTDGYDTSNLESQLEYLDKFSVVYIKEETNESIINAYLKDNNIKEDNLKVYKLNYKVLYNTDAPDKYKSGVYESWFFLTRKNSHSKWLIDICDI